MTLLPTSRMIRIVAMILTSCMLIGTFALIRMESQWAVPITRTPEDAFRHGTVGTELVPLPVLKVLPTLFPEHYQPGGVGAGNWIQQFGFVKVNADDELPAGFTLANYRPRSGAPSPVPFVGFGCATCHSTRIYRSEEDAEGIYIVGAGNASLDFLAFVDALRASVLDSNRLNVESIVNTYVDQGLKPDLTFQDRAMIRLWLSSLRSTFETNVTKYDEPARGSELRNSPLLITGPGRTQPFRNLVRLIMDRPAAIDRGFSKIPAVLHQQRREWAQFDGSVRDFHARSALAVISSGATIDNLTNPEILANVIASTDYTMELSAPKFQQVFQIPLDEERSIRGKQVYEQHCSSCHGRPTAEGWEKGSRQGEVIPVEEVGTDAERVQYRYFDVLADKLFEHFPKKHPLSFPRESIRPGPAGTTRGYIATPLETIYVRAPYLHHGVVLTLAELINLEPRRTEFYRGTNVYDTSRVGLKSPNQPDARRYFKIDTNERGNSNRGHEYPWKYRGPGWNEESLRDLLEYLKTI